MKILRIVSDIYPNVMGGLPIHAHELSNSQAKLGHDVTVLTTCNKISLNINRKYNIVYVNPSYKIYGNSIIPTLPFELFKQRFDFDIIHAHSHLFFSTNVASLIRKSGSSPLVITNHGLRSQRVPSWLNDAYLPTIAKWTYAFADRVICYTEDEKQRVKCLGVNAEKIVIIHNGIDTDLFTPLNNDKSYNQILWIGRFVPGKGVEYLIDAFKIIHEKNALVKLVMIGKGPLKDYIIEKIKFFDLLDNIILIDQVHNSELVSIYRKSDVFILSSLEEGVPRTILEAMSCGIPVVCTELPQLINIVKDCGIIVPIKDSQSIAESILRVLSDKEFAKNLGQKGRITVCEKYSWQDTVLKTIDLYDDLI